jgi:class 3 adenylate cyclase
MLFADMVGFSKLSDSQIVAFLDHVITPLGRALDRYGNEVLLRRRWGDGLHVVFRTVPGAADCALTLQRTVEAIDLPAAGLPSTLRMRVGAHAGPVFEGVDPIRGEPMFDGVHVTLAARVEPRTLAGEVYVTHPFAALAALEGDGSFSCQYVGRVPAAKGYGVLPMYVLKRHI